MKPRKEAESELFRGAPKRASVGAWHRFAESLYDRAPVALGQVSGSAHDEALYLLLWSLGLPLDSEASVLSRLLRAEETAKIRSLFKKRLIDRVPAAYLTREAFLGEHRFHVDERVIIPRSYFLEIIPQLDGVLMDGPRKGKSGKLRMVDVCTGSGCLAILLAHHFEKAQIDAIDLSEEALEVAALNVEAHRLGSRVKLFQSDVFDEVPKAKYDLILSNPPYEPSALVSALPEEFQKEPRMALDGGKDGLDIVRKLLEQARTRLAPHGLVLMEIGGLRKAIDREFAALEPRWLHTEDGSDCVCLIQAGKLIRQRP